MDEDVVTLREAKARLSELTERTAAGHSIVITKHGRRVARLSSATVPRKRVNREQLRALTLDLPKQSESAGHLLRRLRDQSRY